MSSCVWLHPSSFLIPPCQTFATVSRFLSFPVIVKVKMCTVSKNVPNMVHNGTVIIIARQLPGIDRLGLEINTGSTQKSRVFDLFKPFKKILKKKQFSEWLTPNWLFFFFFHVSINWVSQIRILLKIKFFKVNFQKNLSFQKYLTQQLLCGLWLIRYWFSPFIKRLKLEKGLYF